MQISHIKTMILVGKVSLQPNEKKLKFDAVIGKDQLRDRRGRVYCVVVDGQVEKIGGSQDAGGILGTIGWYLNGWAKGNSERSYCMWNYFTRSLVKGLRVEIWCVWAPLVSVEIPTMTGMVVKEMPVDFHTIEKAFNDEFFKVEGRHPSLNMQESGRRWQDTGLLEGYINKDGTVYGANVMVKV